jgi:hypothetical protein
MYFNQYLLLQLVHNVFKSLKLCQVSLELNFEFFKISSYAFIICIRFYNERVWSWSYRRRQANEEMVLETDCRKINN